MGLLRTGASRSIEEGVGNQERLPGGGAPTPSLPSVPWPPEPSVTTLAPLQLLFANSSSCVISAVCLPLVSNSVVRHVLYYIRV